MKMNKRKTQIIFYVLLLFAFMCFHTGCGTFQIGKYEPAFSDHTGEKSPNARVKINITNWSTGYMKRMEQLISEFNETNNDNTEIVLLKIARERYSEVVNLMMASGEGPDVFAVNNELMYSFIYKNWLVDLSKYIDDGYLGKFPSWAVNFARDPAYGGSFYTIPSTEITFRLIYNKDLFRRAGLNPEVPPSTLDELRLYARKITESGKGDRKYGFALPIEEEWAGFVQSMEMPNSISGIYYYNFKEGRYDLTVYKTWFETILEMKKEGSLFPGASSMKNDSARAQFAEGNIGMMYASSWDPSMLFYTYPAKCDWEVALPPVLDNNGTGKGAVPICAGTCYAINAMTDDVDKAFSVWSYLNSEEYTGELFKSGEEIPVFTDIISNPAYKPELKNFNKFIPTDKDSPYPNTPRFINDWSRMNAYSEAISGNSPVEEVLSNETERLNTLLETSEYAMRADMWNYTNPKFNPVNPIGTTAQVSELSSRK